MSDAEILALLAEEAEFAKGELSGALQAEGDDAGELSPMLLILDGLRESAEALGLQPMADMMSWVAANLQRFKTLGGADIQRTLLLELLSGWLSSFIGLCANPENKALRDSFEAALGSREWPESIPDALLGEILECVSVAPLETSLEESGVVAASREVIDLRAGASVDDEVWEGFVSQGREEVAVLGELLRDPDLEIYGELARDAEELAGSVASAARAMEIPAIAELAKNLEDLLESMEEGEVEEERVGLVLRAISILDTQFQHIGEADAPREADPAPVLYEIRGLLDTETTWLGMAPAGLEEELGEAELTAEVDEDELVVAQPDANIASGAGDATSEPALGNAESTSLLFDPATDPRILEAFFEETPGQAVQLVDMLRGVERDALIGEVMMEAQRIAHTIKGACAFVGLQSVYDLCYPLEEALEGLETSPPSPEFGELLIEVADVIEFLFDGIASQSDEAPIGITPYVEKLWEWARLLNPQEEDEEGGQQDSLEGEGEDPLAGEESTSLRMEQDVDPRLIEAFFAETPGIVRSLVEFLRQGEALSGEDVVEAQRLAHTLKGSCGFVGLDEVYDLAYPLEEALEGLGTESPPAGFAELLVEIADILELLFELLLNGEKAAPIDCAPFVAELWQWAHQINPEQALDEGTIDTSSKLLGEEEEGDSALVALNELADDRAEPVMAEEAELGGLDASEFDHGIGIENEGQEAFDPTRLEESSLFEDLPSFDLEAMASGGVNTRLAQDLDPQLVEAFHLETPDQIAELGNLLRSAQRGELVGETVTDAQRVAHTVKGACALVGLDEVRDLTHHLEDVLELLGEDAPPQELGELLAEAGDILETVFDAIQAGEEEASVDIDGILAGFGDWARRLGESQGAQPGTTTGGVTDISLAADLDPQLAEAFFLETPDQVSELAVLLRAADEGGLLGELVTEAQRLAHTVKGACALVGLEQVQIFAHRLEDVLERLGVRPPPDPLAALLVEVADTLEGIFDGVTARQTQVPISLDALISQLDEWAARLSGEGEDDEERIDQDVLDEEGDLSAEGLLWDENVDPKMLDQFFIEAPEDAGVLCKLIYEKRIQQDDNRSEAARRAQAVEHWSRTVGISPLRRIGQYLKVILQAPREEPFTPAAMGMLEENAELLDNLLGAIQGKNDPVHDAGERIRDLAQWATRVADSLKEAHASDVKTGAVAAKREQAPAKVAESSLRVPTSRIIDLMRLVGEMTTAVAQLQGRLSPVLEYVSAIHRQGLVTSQRLADLETLVEVRSRPADETAADFDPLEMDQYHELYGIASALNEAFVDSQEIAKLAEDQVQDLAMIAHRQERLSRDVNEAVLATRMIPVSVLVPRLERTVREACRAAKKKARIYVEGEHLLADTDIIGGLRDALMHMLRNSVDHGIELPAQRLKKLKSEEGRIDIGFRRQGNTILIRVLDDGAGFDVDKIRHTAAKRGLNLEPDLPASEVLRLVLMPGFSTKQNVTTLSGRGIGMDVVRQSVEELGGTMVLNNRPEGGAETAIRLPLTLVSAPVLLVRYAGQRFAIPSDDVNQILYPDEGSIYPTATGWRFRLGGENFKIRSLASLIGRGSDEREFEEYTGKTVLLIQQDTGALALLLDRAEESRDVVVQQLGPWLQSVKGVAGACILANGDVAPIIDMRAMLRDEKERSLTEDLEQDFFESYYDDDEAEKIPVVMMVDDSLSARKSLEIAVEAAGYQAVPAIDGLDAIRLMDEQLPDLMLVDMEMPRMNGLELATHVRAQAETVDIPVVMITSRSTKKHRDRAMAAGVTHYLTKPFDQEQLHGIMEALLHADVKPSRGEE